MTEIVSLSSILRRHVSSTFFSIVTLSSKNIEETNYLFITHRSLELLDDKRRRAEVGEGAHGDSIKDTSGSTCWLLSYTVESHSVSNREGWGGREDSQITHQAAHTGFCLILRVPPRKVGT